MRKFNLASATVSLLMLANGCASAKRVAVYIGPQAGDIISTHVALQMPHAYEANAPIKNESALAATKLALASIAMWLDKYLVDHGHDPKWVRITSVAIGGYFTAKNVKLLEDQKGR